MLTLAAAPCLHVDLQTAKGNEAKTPPADEIRDVLRMVWIKIKSHPAWQELIAAGLYPIYSLDNAHVHTSAVKDWDTPGGWRTDAVSVAALGCSMGAGESCPMGTIEFVPPLSPDLHQIIEHVHGNTARGFKAWVSGQLRLGKLRDKVTKDVFWEPLVLAFEQASKPSSIARNVDSLRETWQAVLAAKGGRIDSSLC